MSSRPRYSVLSLFDPLENSSPSTPVRNAPSPDSDKENTDPPTANFTMTTFFNRIYKPSQYPQPTFKRRLIDIGDVTMDDISMHEMLTDDDSIAHDLSQIDDDEDGDDTLTFRDMAKAATPNWKATSAFKTSPRTPLADLPTTTPEPEPTPIPRSKIFKRPQHTTNNPSTLSQVETFTSDNPLTPSINAVINSVNTSSSSFAEANPETTYSEPVSQILVSSNETGFTNIFANIEEVNPSQALAESISILDVTTSTSLLTEIPVLISPPSPEPLPVELPPAVVDEPVLQSQLRPHFQKTLSQDSNRRSIDLHASFQLHLQSPDNSFDLINDKVSFFYPRTEMDSFLKGLDDEESFDLSLEKERMATALKEIKIEEERFSDEKRVSPVRSLSIQKEFLDAIAVPLPESPVESAYEEEEPVTLKRPASKINVSPKSPTFVSRLKKRSSLLVSPSMRSFSGSLPSSPIDSSPSLRQGLVFVAEKLEPKPLVPALTPGPSKNAPRLPPPAVPALKIVKRSKLVLGKATPTIRTCPTENSSVSANSLTLPTIIPLVTRKIIPQVDIAPQRMRQASTNTTNVSRPSRVTLGSPQVFQTSRPLQQIGAGPRRVPISEGPNIMNNMPKSSTNGTGGIERTVGNIGPRRVPNPVILSREPPVPIVPAPVPAIGLKYKYGTVGSSSAIPKPVARTALSRLPAPSSRRLEGCATEKVGPVRRVL